MMHFSVTRRMLSSSPPPPPPLFFFFLPVWTLRDFYPESGTWNNQTSEEELISLKCWRPPFVGQRWWQICFRNLQVHARSGVSWLESMCHDFSYGRKKREGTCEWRSARLRVCVVEYMCVWEPGNAGGGWNGMHGSYGWCIYIFLRSHYKIELLCDSCL